MTCRHGYARIFSCHAIATEEELGFSYNPAEEICPAAATWGSSSAGNLAGSTHCACLQQVGRTPGPEDAPTLRDSAQRQGYIDADHEREIHSEFDLLYADAQASR